MRKIKKYMSGLMVLCLNLMLLAGCDTAGVSVENSALADNALDDATAEKSSDDGTISTSADENINSVSGNLTVTFLNVGQGNSVLVENDGYYMLIDGGNRDYSSFVVSYLKQQGVTDLSYVIPSHYDADHLNGVVGALNVFDCGLILSPDYETDTKIYTSYRSIVAQKQFVEVHPARGDTYELGDAYFTVVCPENYGASDDNANSVGIRLVYGENAFLICGDAPIDVEQEMIASGETLKSDVYVASHHGSNGASSNSFLQAVSPEYVVVSAGLDNSYGHPGKDTMNRIQSSGAQVLRTDLQGTLTATSDGTNITWNVEPCNNYRSGDEIAGTTSEKQNSSLGTNTDAGLTDNANVATQAASDTTEQSYVVNTNTKKFHKTDCSSVSTMSEKNTMYFSGTRDELIAEGYSSCKRCNP